MVYKLHEDKLAVGSLGVRHILERPTQLLDSHVTTGNVVVCRAVKYKKRRTIIQGKKRNYRLMDEDRSGFLVARKEGMIN